ncbi:glycosyltransferase family 18 protein [Calocera cornea HHB12733]|uniref:alpha-1,6-mannosyl-glycoprotein 6-beta-N-acetylglucosaminyltransferase n=1 Tax=Calocera cornea HHB12733 TaxID=1353952 RepID=A0A165EVJ5_9BASI|nr:glycosyltransferase family 18 protein [Calocera cornea HHB12733]
MTGFLLLIAVGAFVALNGHLALLDFTRDKLTLHPSPYLDLLFPLATPDDVKNTEDSNARTLQSLMSCLATGTCGENQTKIVLLADAHFSLSVKGSVSGEDIWAASILHAIQELGYSYLYSDNLASALFQYRMFPDLVYIIVAECGDITDCFNDPTCVKTSLNTLGIPIWKMFSLHFWDGACHPLGGSWTLSPEDYRNGNQYLGYSLEAECLQKDFVPHERRVNQVYILAKWLRYFYASSYPWPRDALARIEHEAGVQLVAGFGNDTDYPPPWTLPVTNHGQMEKEQFYDRLSQSRALLGVGQPYLSPSPYDALCFGVPFINPIDNWDKDQPENRSRWTTQHDGLRFIEEPYVYHVQKGDTEGLVRAVRSAQEKPIERYTPPAMTRDALVLRVSALVEHDWLAAARLLLNAHTQSGAGVSFVPRGPTRHKTLPNLQRTILL